MREFRDELKEVIYKPVMGGALTERLDENALEKLDAITTSPVIFQERIRGDDVYSSGGATYREVKLPDRVAEFCRRAARECGLVFAGIDIKHQGDDWVFLELNSSPIYLDVERKLGHPISAAIARYIVEHARQES